MSEQIVYGRPFVLRRDRDISDVSGTGIVADGTLFPDGHAVIHWRGRWPLTTPHPDGMDSIIAIHDHGGRGDLHVLWADEMAAVPAQRCGEECSEGHVYAGRCEQVTVHACPPDGSGLMPCCGRTPFEAVPDRMTTDPRSVTCQGAAAPPGGCADKTPDIRADNFGPTIPNRQVNEGESADSPEDIECRDMDDCCPGGPSACRLDASRAWLREQYAAAIQRAPFLELRRDAGEPVQITAYVPDLVEAVLTVRDAPQACPYCTGGPQFPRRELGAHMQAAHGRILTALARGLSLDELLHDAAAQCRLPHEMEA